MYKIGDYKSFVFMASIKRNFLYNLLLQISKVLFPLITAPYIARTLDPEGVGIVNFVNTYSSYFALFAVLGIPIYGVREIAKIRDDIQASETFVSQMISLEFVTTLFVSCIYIISVCFIGQLNEHALLFLVAGISLYITPFKIEWFFSGREEFGYITFRSLVIKTLSVVLLFFVVKDKGDIVNYVLLNLFATIANEFWNYVKLYKLGIRPHFTLSGCKIHLKPVLTLFASSIAISIYVMLDTLMLGFRSSYQEVGYYNCAMQLVRTLLPVTTALATVVIPKVAIYYKSENVQMINELVTKSLGLVSFLAFPITVGVIMIAPVFVPLFFGESFYGSILPMQIGSIIIVAIGLNNLNGVQILTGMAKDKLFLISVITGAIVNFCLNWFLIPLCGAAGAAFASISSEMIILLLNELFVRRYTQVRVLFWGDLFKSLGGALLFIPLCLVCGQFFKGWLYVFTCIAICISEYILFQKWTKNETFKVIYINVLNKMNVKCGCK